MLNVITTNTKMNAILDMTGFPGVIFTVALNLGKAISHIVVKGLLQLHGKLPQKNAARNEPRAAFFSQH